MVAMHCQQLCKSLQADFARGAEGQLVRFLSIICHLQDM